MAEKTFKDIIEQLKIGRQQDAYLADESAKRQEELAKQLGSLNKQLGAFFLNQKAGAGDDLEAQREKREQKADVQKSKNGPPTTFKEGFMQGSGLGFLTNLASLPMALLTGVLGTKLAKTLLPKFGLVLGRTLLRGPLIGALALFGEDVLTKGIEGLTGIDLEPDDATKLNDSLKESLALSIISKRLGLARLVGGAIGFGLDKMFDLDDAAKANLFGFELPISELDLATYGSTIAAFFGPTLIAGALTRAFTGKTPTGASVGRNAKGQFTKLKPGLASTFRRGFVGRGGLGWGAVVAGLGLTAGTIIGDAIGSEETGEVIGNALVTAGLVGAFFGPQGAIIAALTYMAFKGIGAVADWLKNKSDNYTKQLQMEFDALPEDLGALGLDDQKLAQETLAKYKAEAERKMRLASQKEIEQGEKMNEALQQKLYQLPYQNNATMNAIYLDKILANDAEASENFLNFFKDKIDSGRLDFQDLSMMLANGEMMPPELKALTSRLQQEFGRINNMNFGDPDFQIPQYQEPFSKKSLLGRGKLGELLAPNNDAFYNLMPPMNGNVSGQGGGEGGMVTNNFGGSNSSAMMSPIASVQDLAFDT